MYRQIDQVFKMLKMFKILGTDLLSNWLNPLLLDEVSPLGSTALVTAVWNLGSEWIGNLSTETNDDWTDQIRGSLGDDSSASSA